VRRLIVADIAPVVYGHQDENASIIDALLDLPLDRIKSRAEADSALAAKLDDPTLRAFLLANLARGPGGFQWKIDLAALKRSLPALHGFPDLPSHYDGPTLFLRGEKSGYVRDSHRPAINRYFPNARIETIAGAAHWLHADKPDEVFGLISAFSR
jgi:pimeloyl-ACP methyl ester carboxylesterase